MKKVIQFIFIKLLIISVLGGIFYLIMDFNTAIVVVEGNSKKEVLPVGKSKYQDAHCGMLLESAEFAAQVVAPNGKTWFFHDQGGVPLWLESKSFKDQATIWMFTKDSKKWRRAEQLFFSLTDETPMHYGFVAHQVKQPHFISYREMRLKMLRGENLLDPNVRRNLLGGELHE